MSKIKLKLKVNLEKEYEVDSESYSESIGISDPQEIAKNELENFFEDAYLMELLTEEHVKVEVVD